MILTLLTNWRLIAIVSAVLAALTGAGIVWHNIDKAGYQRRAAEDAAAQVEVLKSRLGALQLTAASDAARAATDHAYIDQLETLSRETPKNDGVCLDADAARRVRAIGSPNTKPAPVPARRSTNLFQKRSGNP
jgi:hypothetical protein